MRMEAYQTISITVFEQSAKQKQARTEADNHLGMLSASATPCPLTKLPETQS